MNLYREIILFFSGGVPNRRSLVGCVSPKVSPGLSPAPIFHSAQLCCFLLLLQKLPRLFWLWSYERPRITEETQLGWCAPLSCTKHGSPTLGLEPAAPLRLIPSLPTSLLQGARRANLGATTNAVSFPLNMKIQLLVFAVSILLLSLCQAIRFDFLDVLGLEGAQTVWN